MMLDTVGKVYYEQELNGMVIEGLYRDRHGACKAIKPIPRRTKNIVTILICCVTAAVSSAIVKASG